MTKQSLDVVLLVKKLYSSISIDEQSPTSTIDIRRWTRTLLRSLSVLNRSIRAKENVGIRVDEKTCRPIDDNLTEKAVIVIPTGSKCETGPIH